MADRLMLQEPRSPDMKQETVSLLMKKLTAIAETFQVSVDYLLDSTDEPIVLHSMPEAERMLDRQIFQVYRTLSLAEKEDAYEYLCFLKQREQKH